MKARWNDQSGRVPFIEKLKEAVQVGLGVFLFCAVSIVGISAIAWPILIALDPAHSTFTAAIRVVRFDLIPLGVVTGLAIFLAALSWDSPWTKTENFERNVHRRLIAIEKRLKMQRSVKHPDQPPAVFLFNRSTNAMDLG